MKQLFGAFWTKNVSIQEATINNKRSAAIWDSFNF